MIIVIIIYVVAVFMRLPESHEVIIVDAGNESIIIAPDTWISYGNKLGKGIITVEGPVDPTKIIVGGHDIDSFEVLWTKNNVTIMNVLVWNWEICRR